MTNDVVIKSIKALPYQLQQSWAESKAINFPLDYKQPTNVVIAGMGGSRFPGLIVSELFKTELLSPIIINDNYHLPGFVNEKTLVILSSYSGTTEEVLTMGKIAYQKKAKITGITSGGQLADFCRQKKLPFYLFNPIHNPSKQPRIGFGYTVGGLLGILFNLGLIKVRADLVDKALKSFPKPEGAANQLAQKIYQKYPYFVVAEFLTGVGNALANQTNETAKSISSFRVIPELNHHLMEGLKHPKELVKIALFVFFYSDLYSLPIKKRFTITKEVVKQNKIETVWYHLSGENKIEQVFELMSLGSHLTLDLSELYHEDPAIIPFVNYFKKRLKETK